MTLSALTPQRYLTHTLRAHPAGEAVARVLHAAIQAVDPATAVRRHLERSGDSLYIAGRTYNLRRLRRVFLLAFGKAALPMAQAAGEILADCLNTALVIPKAGNAQQAEGTNHKFRLIPAAHPIPDARNLRAGEAVSALLRDTHPDDLLLCLISGGGSALLTAPVAGVALADLQSLTRRLLACGATIEEINILRKHLSRLKGGRLAQQAAPAHVEALILSDVVGSPPDAIASGPCAPDPTTYAEALAVLRRYHLLEDTPPAILAHLQRGQAGELPETPKATDPLFRRVHNTIIAENLTAARAARRQAEAEGLRALVLTTFLQGEARTVGPLLVALARQSLRSGDPLPPPACLICGGETTVTLRGEGLGGRNQEVALSAVQGLNGLSALLVTLASDGEDGPTDAAGAVVSGDTLRRARQRHLNPEDFLSRNDAYSFFQALGDLLHIGPTQTNVNDLNFVFTFPETTGASV